MMSWPLTVLPMVTILAIDGLAAAACSYSALIPFSPEYFLKTSKPSAACCVRLLGRGLAVHLLGAHLHALLGQLLGLAVAEDRLDPDLRLLALLAGDLAELQVMTVDAEVDELVDLAGGHLADVDIEMVVRWSGDRGARAQQASNERKD